MTRACAHNRDTVPLNAKVLFTDAESPSEKNFIADYKEECFVCLIKKMILLKK